MKEFPMLKKIDDDRVKKVGGKAAILEQIVERFPSSNVPDFSVHENTVPEVFFGQTRIFRASSFLDLFGGCGIHDTFSDVDFINYKLLGNTIFHPEESMRHLLFGASVRKMWREPALINQVQGTPNYWGSLLQHPNNSDYYLVSSSNVKSAQCKSGIHGSNMAYVGKEGEYGIFDRSGTMVRGTIPVDKHHMIGQAIQEYSKAQESLIDDNWVSIQEFGMYDDHVEIYQHTPIRQKTSNSNQLPAEGLIFGGTEPLDLPIVNFPNWPMYYRENHDKLEERFPHLSAFVERMKGSGSYTLEGPELSRFYTQFLEQESVFSEGYIVVSEFGTIQDWDICMTKARAVIMQSSNPLESLDHNLSRLLYKAPALVVGDLNLDLKTGDRMRFSCDGANYSIG